MSGTAAVILAAGQGTRFRSDLAKVLHRAAGRTLLRWVLEAVRPLAVDRVIVVVGYQADEVTAEARAAAIEGLHVVRQSQQLGTGHAVRCVVEDGALDDVDRVLVLPGDVPLLTAEPLQTLLEAHRPVATLLTARMPDPTGYGRVVRGAGGQVGRITEERDATEVERAIDEVATSIYAFDPGPLAEAVAGLGRDNAQGEEYLTDVIATLAESGVGAVATAPELVAGVNDRRQLADAATVLRRRILDRWMLAGVTVVDPATSYVEADVQLERDAVLLPGTHLEGTTHVGHGTVIGPNTRVVDSDVQAGATIAYSVVINARVGPRATVGPFAYLRPAAKLERQAKVGAFVEVKNSTVGEGSKVPHLSYIGDTTIGRDANIGAATVTVNYDGFEKHETVIGDRARVGSDTMLVAPVHVGDDAYTGAGSVITKDVPDGALAVERTEQRIIEGYAERRRARHDQAKE